MLVVGCHGGRCCRRRGWDVDAKGVLDRVPDAGRYETDGRYSDARKYTGRALASGTLWMQIPIPDRRACNSMFRVLGFRGLGVQGFRGVISCYKMWLIGFEIWSLVFCGERRAHLRTSNGRATVMLSVRGMARLPRSLCWAQHLETNLCARIAPLLRKTIGSLMRLWIRMQRQGDRPVIAAR